MPSETPAGIHMPQPSFWPIALAISVLLIITGVLTSLLISLIGVLALIGCVVGWALENRADEEGMESHV
jgi:hypothetical protein